jgi:ATP-dependent Clp protease ATP-binding subunit ClpB
LEQSFPTLATRFEVVEVPEASLEFSASVLEALRPSLQEFHGVTIEDSAIAATIELVPRLRPERALPGGAVDLLDAAAARLAVEQIEVLDEEQVRRVA